jgi:alpha/beta superfamily hydrolase
VTAPASTLITLTTSDGHQLSADLALSDVSSGGLVLCHPHPLYGGSRRDSVIAAVWDAARTAGLSAIRFDFRQAHDKGAAERHDVAAAAAALAPRRIVLVGYSFGSYVCLRSDAPGVAGWVGIAPIVEADDHCAGCDDRPTLLLTAGHDQYAPPAQVIERTAAWQHTTIHQLPGADHFLAGHHREVAERTVAFASGVLGSSRDEGAPK